MQREIKFKALKKNTNQWLYGVPSYDMEYIYNEESMNSIDNYEIESNTICQFTGLKDSVGNEIYEGDILQGISNNLFSEGMIFNHIVIWGVDSWHIKDTFFSIQEFFNYCNNRVKIIGNIFEKQGLSIGVQ